MGSVFSHHNTHADRSASDRRRHKEKIERAIKDGIHCLATLFILLALMEEVECTLERVLETISDTCRGRGTTERPGGSQHARLEDTHTHTL